ncbi:hypothetical protein ACIBJI_04935 [Nocardia sp. NPDC050408]|uniref:hypothetical protein n=1 Tax=unclassified Nocardia TaxID=2637762 RepID=UPI00343DF06C
MDCQNYSRATTTAVGAREICGNCVREYQSCDDCARLCTDTYGVQDGNRVCDTCLDEVPRMRCVLRSHPLRRDLPPGLRPSRPSCGLRLRLQTRPRFHGDGPLFLGLELEIKTTPATFDNPVDTVLAHAGDLAYLKEDSSISPCGFELVTHPVSYEYAPELR